MNYCSARTQPVYFVQQQKTIAGTVQAITTNRYREFTMQQFKLHKIALGTLTALMLTPAVAQEVTLANTKQATEANTQLTIVTGKQIGRAHV